MSLKGEVIILFYLATQITTAEMDYKEFRESRICSGENNLREKLGNMTNMKFMLRF